jgi:hypothetical protein
MFKKALLLFSFFALFGPFGATRALAAQGDTFNFRFSPLSVLLNGAALGLDIAITDQWTIGPALEWANFDFGQTGILTEDIEIKVFGIAARANWFANGTYTDGFYIGPYLQYVKAEAESSDGISSVEGKVNAIYAGSLFGYGWFWDNFNIMLGAGFGLGVGDTKIEVKDSSGNEVTKVNSSGGVFAGEFTLGWTF